MKKWMGKLAAPAVAISVLMSAGAQAAAPEELVALNNQWQPLMNAKDVDGLDKFYDADSLLGQFPYDSSKNLQGLEAISQMFAGGPFGLPELKAQVDTLALDAKDDTALLVKNWDISFKDGGFKGLAVEVLSNTPDGWKRRIDIGAGGLTSAAGFADTDTEVDNTAFNSLADDYAIRSAGAARVSLDDAELPDFAEGFEVDNLLSVEQGSNGLLISRLTGKGQSFLLFNAVEKTAEGWQVKVQMSAVL